MLFYVVVFLCCYLLCGCFLWFMVLLFLLHLGFWFDCDRFAGLGAQEIPTVKIRSCFVKILLMIIIRSRCDNFDQMTWVQFNHLLHFWC